MLATLLIVTVTFKNSNRPGKQPENYIQGAYNIDNYVLIDISELKTSICLLFHVPPLPVDREGGQ